MGTEPTLRELLCLTDIFWTDNLGQNIDHFTAQLPDLLVWPDEEITAELQKMEDEGLVVRMHGCWGSTDAGRKLREHVYRQRGWRAACLSHIHDFDIDDLILAVAATPSVCGQHRHQDCVQLQEYLFERADECDAAVERLCAGGLIRAPLDFPSRRRALFHTSKGLRHYHQTTRPRLAIDEGKCVLDAPATDDVYKKLVGLGLDGALEAAVLSRWREAVLCEASGAFLAAAVMYGAVLEGLLLGLVKRSPAQANRAAPAPKDATGRVLPFAEWKLQDLIEVGRALQWIPAGAAKHCHELRDTRNLVHPWKQAVDGVEADKHLAHISRIVVTAAVHAAPL